MKFKLFIIFVLICLSCPAWAATYYVKNGGNDSLDGLSDSTAWATIAKVEATVGSGDVVYFRSQDTWTNASRGAVLVPTAGVKYFGTGYGSGTRAKFLAGRSASGGYYGVIDINVSNVTVSGFEVDGNYASNSYNNDGIAASWSGGNISGITIDNCVVHNTGLPHGGWGHGIIVTNYTQHTTSNVVLTNNTVYDTQKGNIFLYASWTSANNVVDTVLVRNNTVYNGGTGPNIEVCNDIRNATIEFNNIHDSTSGYSGLNVRTSSDPGVARGKPTNLIIRYNLIYNSSSRGIDFWPNYYAQDITADVYGNLFYNNGNSNTACDGASINISNSAGYPSWGNSVLNFYNNTIYDTNSGCTNSRYGISLGVWGTSLSGTPTITFKNNIIYTGNFTAFYDGQSWLSSGSHSNNLIYRSSGTLVRSGSTNYTSANLSTWEATSRLTNPSFSGGTLPTGFSGTYGSNMVPNTDYFQLTVDSPAKDTGATLEGYTGSINGAGLTTPIVRPLGAAFDIGAYEYGTVAQSGGSAGQGFKLQGVTIR
jgi:hypothetical protein